MRIQMKTAGFCCLLLSLLLAACSNFENIKEIDEIDYEPSVAVPLINSTVTLSELVEEDDDLDFMSINADGSVEFSYESEIFRQGAEEVLEPLETVPLILPDSTVALPFDVFEDLSVRYMDFKSGSIQFELSSVYTEDIEVTISIPQMTKNGVTFSTTKTIAYTGNTPSTATIDPIDLSGYLIENTNDELELKYDARNGMGQRVMINPILGSANEWTFESIRGYSSPVSLLVQNDTFEINIYDNWTQGDLTLADPRLDITVNNSFGFPTRGLIQFMKVITIDGQEIFFNSPVTGNQFEINYPSVSEMVTSKQTVFSFTKENSNIDQILNSKPAKLIYVMDVVINPDNDQTVMGFVHEDSELTSEVNINLPAYGTAKGFEVEYDFEIDMGDVDQVKELEFKLFTNNGIPVDLISQLYFTDANGVVLDSLFTNELALVRSATVDPSGNVNMSTETTHTIPFAEERINQIKNFKYALLRASMSTYNDGNTPIRVNANHSMDIILGVNATLDVE